MEYAHVLDVEVRVAGPNTARSEVACLDQGTVGIEVIDNRISILLLTSGENHDLEMLISRLETLVSVRSNIDAGEDWFWLF